MIEHYLAIKFVHILCVGLSGTLFAIRGILRLAGSALAHHASLRFLSVAIDTCLLVAAVLLTGIVHQYPFVDSWLTAKVLLLFAYIVLGSFALRRARTRAGSAACFVAALGVFATIVGIAIAHDVRGWWVLLRS
ncbi:MAG TPA: SirB2 family protein [Rudaea sp.]|nr:SirB2 family protein [Rudaea sp.]